MKKFVTNTLAAPSVDGKSFASSMHIPITEQEYRELVKIKRNYEKIKSAISTDIKLLGKVYKEGMKNNDEANIMMAEFAINIIKLYKELLCSQK